MALSLSKFKNPPCMPCSEKYFPLQSSAGNSVSMISVRRDVCACGTEGHSDDNESSRSVRPVFARDFASQASNFNDHFKDSHSFSTIVAPNMSHYGTEEVSRRRNLERVNRDPSLEQMAEALQVHMMNKTPRDPIPAEYSSHVLHLLENFRFTQNHVARANYGVRTAVDEISALSGV